MRTAEHITGLVLAGGRGSRMGGGDKGLQSHLGVPLALHAIRRLSPQVGTVMVSANCHLDTYASFGVPVWPDAMEDHPGPLAGFLAGLEHCRTPYLVTVPCDTPNFPTDLVARLAQGLMAHGAQMAIAATRESEGVQVQPVFSLMASGLKGSLLKFIASGQRSVERWAALHCCATVLFDDEAAFTNANTAQELQRLQTPAITPGVMQAGNRDDGLPVDGLA
jgi:molybdopterin-guanine dinucleotide biosynthesis protein A